MLSEIYGKSMVILRKQVTTNHHLKYSPLMQHSLQNSLRAFDSQQHISIITLVFYTKVNIKKWLNQAGWRSLSYQKQVQRFQQIHSCNLIQTSQIHMEISFHLLQSIGP